MTSRLPGRPSDPISTTLKIEDNLDLDAEFAKAMRDQRVPVLVVMSGNDTGVHCHLRGTMVVGRDPKADLTLSDAGVSFRHARVENRGEEWAIVDLGSKNGTKLNGANAADFVLAHGDLVTFGATEVRFEVQDAIERAFDDVLERRINVDELTGLWVRRRFDNELRGLLEATVRRHATLGLLTMDLDGVKAINDTHGHLAGAYVIGEAGRVIGQVIGERGVAARFGGDEFVVALPDFDLRETLKIAEEVRANINLFEFTYQHVALHPGISIGVAMCPEHGKSAGELFRAADAALYRAKAAGKNRVSA